MLDLIAQACSVVFDPTTITFIIVGTICGVIFGALPGVSATMAVVIAMTFSYSMDGLPSIAFLVSVYCAAITGGGISAIGGMVYIVTTAGCVWNHEGLSGVGWLAVALVIFCMWHPLSAIWGSIFFGALMILYLRLIIPFIPTQLYKILPYLVTVIVLVISSMRNNKEKQPPASLGLNYFREER